MFLALLPLGNLIPMLIPQPIILACLWLKISLIHFDRSSFSHFRIFRSIFFRPSGFLFRIASGAKCGVLPGWETLVLCRACEKG